MEREAGKRKRRNGKNRDKRLNKYLETQDQNMDTLWFSLSVMVDLYNRFILSLVAISDYYRQPSIQIAMPWVKTISNLREGSKRERKITE